MKTQPTTGPSQARRVNVPEEPKKKGGAFDEEIRNGFSHECVPLVSPTSALFPKHSSTPATHILTRDNLMLKPHANRDNTSKKS